MSAIEGVYFIDTNVFLRVLIREDEKSFRDCTRFLVNIKEGKIRAATSTIILAEVNWTLSSFYQFSKDETIEALNSILNLKNLKILDHFNPLQAVELFGANNIKFIDALIASHNIITRGNGVVVSYDKDFDKINVSRKGPGDIIK